MLAISRRVLRPLFLTTLLSVAATESITAKVFLCDVEDVQCLIAAINDANTTARRDTIRLLPGTYTIQGVDNTTDGPNGLPSITTPIVIESALVEPATLTRIAAEQPVFRLLHVAPTGQLTLRRITVTGFNNDFPLGTVLNVGGVVNIRASTVSSATAAGRSVTAARSSSRAARSSATWRWEEQLCEP